MQIVYILLFLVLLFFVFLKTQPIEGFRGGARYFRHHAPPRQSPKHKWLRGTTTNIFDGTSYYYGGFRPTAFPSKYNMFPSWLNTKKCPKGCGYIGLGELGCVNPTNSSDSCFFTSDCYGC